jgi:tetratricopeptide (TPR) repeat protein
MIATHRQLSAERQRIIGDMQRNLALKRAIEKDYATLAADTKTYRRDVDAATRFCRGRFDEPEYRRRKAICEAKQAELDKRQAELEQRKRELDARDGTRQKDALRLKAAFDALGQRTKTIEDSMARFGPFASINARCRQQGDPQAVSQCLDEGWTAVAEQTRQVLDLQTGDAFREGDDLRRAIAQSTWSLPDKVLATLASFLADIGRYGDAAAIIGRVKSRQPADQLLISTEARLVELAHRAAQHPGASQNARDLAEQLKISHLSMQARTAVLLSLLYFREGNYERSLAYLVDAQKSHPADGGIADMIFLTSQAELAREERAQRGALTERAARVLQREGALAALNLGFLLIDSDSALQAEIALSTARERIATARETADWSLWRVPTLDVIDKLIQRVRTEGTTVMAQAAPRVADRWTKADFMLDALAYGQKSWSRSLQYLEIARAAHPENPRIREAYDELSMIAASAK